MLRLATTVVLTLLVACAVVLVELQIELVFVPQERGDRAIGLAAGLIAGTAVYAWLYAVAVGFAFSRSFRVSGWPKLAGAACLLALPPVLFDGLSGYFELDLTVRQAFEYPVFIMAAPFTASIFVALIGMTSNKSQGVDLDR